MNLEIKQALSLHQKGKLNEAEKLYLNILSNFPNDSGILQLLGTLYLQKNEIELSKKLFQKYNWPTIDVTRKSVEETAASILKIHDIFNHNE